MINKDGLSSDVAFERYLSRKAADDYLANKFDSFLSDHNGRLDARAKKDVSQRYLQMGEQIKRRFEQCTTREAVTTTAPVVKEKIDALFERLTAKYGA